MTAPIADLIPRTARGLTATRRGIVAPAWVPLGPTVAGGVDGIVALTARGFAERGHEVVVGALGLRIADVECISVLAEASCQADDQAGEWLHPLGAVNALSSCDVVMRVRFLIRSHSMNPLRW
jgi:hypothetical protein